VESSAVGFVAEVFQAIQGHGTRLRWCDEYVDVEFSAFCSGGVIGGGVKIQNRFRVAAVDFERPSVSIFHFG